MPREFKFHNTITLLLVLGIFCSPALAFTGSDTGSDSKPSQQKRAASSTRQFTLHDYEFKDTPLDLLIRTIAAAERINVVYEDAIAKLVETKKISFEVKGVSAPRALELLLNAERLGYAQIDRRTIMIFPEALANRQRYEHLLVKIFYLKNANIDDVRNAIQQGVGSKQMVPFKQLNALQVRDTPENLKLIDQLITKIDKPKTEFVIDLNLYEVNDQTANQLGNQAGALSKNDTALLQNKNSARLIGATKLHAFENESAVLNMGKRIPISTGSKAADQPAASAQANVQYVDVGLNIELRPIAFEDQINLTMALDLTGALNSLPQAEFNQHRVKEQVTIKNGETKIVANTFQLAGNFFASSAAQSNNSNIIITITPHEIRAPEITPTDRTAIGPNGTSNEYGEDINLEELIIRAEQTE